MAHIFHETARKLLCLFFCFFCIATICCQEQSAGTIRGFPPRASRLDGWYNNLDHPDWGTAGSGMTRKAAALYEDGAQIPEQHGMPNAKHVSGKLFHGKTGISSESGHSVFFAYFAQLLTDDMMDTKTVTCPNEYINIRFTPTRNSSAKPIQEVMPMYRAKYLSKTGSSPSAPRILMNEVTAWLDGSVIYGASNSWTEHLRSYESGMLQEGKKGFPPFNRNEIPLYNPPIYDESSSTPKKRDPKELMSFGNRRGNENPFLISLETIWFRWHNRWAKHFSQEDWSEQKIFDVARRWTVATLQKIAMYDWLPEVTGMQLPPYNESGYNSYLNLGISVEFGMAAMRAGHSLVPSGVVLRHDNCTPVIPLPDEYGASAGEPALRLCNTFFQLQNAILTNGIENIVLGMTSQVAEAADRFVVEDLAEFTYGPPKRSRLDLEALTIQRGRDAGLASYNEARKAYGLAPAMSFRDINRNLSDEVVAQLAELYDNDINRLDMYVGGVLEQRTSFTGELFTNIVFHQFQRTRDSDRYWFENTRNGLFTPEDVKKIMNITMRYVIEATTTISRENLQENVFKTEVDRNTVAYTSCPAGRLYWTPFTISARASRDSLYLPLQGSRCPSIPVIPQNFTKPCKPNTGIDYFHGYWGKFAATLILLLLFPTTAYFIMRAIAWKWQRDAALLKKSLMDRAAKTTSLSKSMRGGLGSDENGQENVFPAFEIEGQEKSRRVLLLLEGTCISLFSLTTVELRKVCFSKFKKVYIFISRNKKRDIMVIRVPKEYDFVLRFATPEDRDQGMKSVQVFMKSNSINVEVFKMDESALKEEAVTKEVRQSLVESFFREAFAEVLQLESVPEKTNKKQRSRALEIADCELAPTELAESMGMKPDSTFVQQLFQIADADDSGYLSFREVADLVVLLMNGSPEQKAQMLFDMYDLDHSGELNREEGTTMIRSFLEMAGAKLGSEEIDAAVEAIFREAGVGKDKDGLTLEDFTHAMLKDHRDAFENAHLSVSGVPRQNRKLGGRNFQSSSVKDSSTGSNRLHTFLTNLPQLSKVSRVDPMPNEYGRCSIIPVQQSNTSRSAMRRRQVHKQGDAANETEKETEKRQVFSEAVAAREEKTWWGRWWKTTKRNIENYRRHIFCMVVFYGITLALMVERAAFYAFGAEHSGIRRVTEWGIIISRSTAAAMSFHYSFILLTMCKNLITYCRETFLKNLIPFDAAVAFHKQIACVAFVETILHVFGHLVNIYHFSVHPLPVLACLFPKLFVDDGSDIPKPATWWVFETIPGATGVLLLLTISVMYVFAMEFSRRFCFRAFFITHHLYAVMYCLIILHGSTELVQKPVFHFYLVVPLVMFFLDKIIIISRSKVEIKVVNVELLPSGVTNLVFKRPTAFDYRSGQWVRIASLALGPNEYHPFTLTSAPHERHLSLHVRAVGPWTTNLRNLYQGAKEHGDALPNLYLDGPFGEGHQDWYKYEVCVLVGAGIGVTPFASILKDIVNKTNTQKGFQITCKQVYFVWVTRTQRHFEWLTDIIKDLEESEGGDLVSTHIYITQFANKFDLRTTMLYICERYFQKVANKSMFTGLQATTHFGRPQFELFFNSLQTMHSDVRTIGVFSCGPPGLTNGVEDACKRVNKLNKARFNHFYENF